MELKLEAFDVLKNKTPLLVLDWFAGAEKTEGLTKVVDKALNGLISKIAKEDNFEGKDGQTLLFRTLGKMPAERILVIGLGDRKAFTAEKARRAAGVAVRKAREAKVSEVTSVIFGSNKIRVAGREAARAITEGALLADYEFSKFKFEEKKSKLKKEIKIFRIIENDSKKINALREGINNGKILAKATILARDLVNEPALHMTPFKLTEEAREIAKASKGKISIKVYEKEALKKMKAGGILGVAMGSDHPPTLVHLVWKPRNAKKKVALVGKAVTFDSGGLSLKPSDSMITMKSDMAGAAAVLGVFSALTNWNPKVEIHGIFAACENMPSGTALRPGDIVSTMSGKTIEILNTDAEGRVTLADSLHYAVKQNPDYIIDIATLTGACVVALGEEVAGLMTNDTRLGQKIKDAAVICGEYIWELPLVKEYEEMVMSKIGNVKNVGGRWGGAITAGLFLQEFVEQTAWAHLDIAGPSFAERDVFSYVPLGGTGFGVRTLLEFLKMI